MRLKDTTWLHEENKNMDRSAMGSTMGIDKLEGRCLHHSRKELRLADRRGLRKVHPLQGKYEETRDDTG